MRKAINGLLIVADWINISEVALFDMFLAA